MEDKINKLKEISVFLSKIGTDIQDEFISRFIPELIDGHIENIEKGREIKS